MIESGVRVPISVVTVALNARPGLEQTAGSLRDLPVRVDEFIVVDGASRDGTRDFLVTDATVSAWLSEPDGGIYDAMNKGWRMAKEGNHILFLGAGDKLLSLPALEELSTQDIIYGDVHLENRGLFVGRADARLVLGNTLHHQALLIPKRLNPEPPFDLRYRTYADYDFNLRLYRRRAVFRKSATFLAYASGGGVSQHLDPREMSLIARRNCGLAVGLASRAYLGYQRMKPGGNVG